MTIRILIGAAALLLCGTLVSAEAPYKFPYDIVTVHGNEAVNKWSELSQDADTTPIIIGNDDDLESLTWLIDPTSGWMPDTSVEDILDRVEELSHPESLNELRDAELKRVIGFLEENDNTELITELKSLREFPAELIGDWPSSPDVLTMPLTLFDYETGLPHERIHIAILPTSDATEAPAYLKFGGWNENPAPEYHIAALRAWRDRFGAVPIVMNRDVIELKVEERPKTREDAIDLAKEQYTYSEDIVYQGVGTISALAASLSESPYWYFWWD